MAFGSRPKTANASFAVGVLTLLLSVAFVSGCGQSGVPRLRIQGKVTHKGQPVPAGTIRFEPDVTKGGSGPVGYAGIVNGEYDTGDGGKGPVGGPMNATVVGYVSDKKFAPEMFPRYRLAVEVSKDNRQVDIDVP